MFDVDTILDHSGLVPKPIKELKDVIMNDFNQFIWSKQREVCDTVEKNRFTSVKSCHGSGKSFLAAQIASAFIARHRPGEAFVITSAPTDAQVKAILWREISAVHDKSELPGRVTQDAKWKIGTKLVAYGRKPADYTNPTQAMQAFQGIHARYVLVILDEACGIPDWLWTAVDTIVTNDNGRVLAIGNPDDPATEFYKTHLPGSGWAQVTISAFDLPCYTGEKVPQELLEMLTGKEWVEERKRKWGEGSPRYVSKVLGCFPEISEDTLITPKMVREAQERDLSADATEHGQFAADIARFGSDETVAYRRRGGVIRRVAAHHKKNTMQTVGILGKLLKDTFNTIPMQIDIIGIGAGVYDRMREQGYNVYPFVASEQAYDPTRYINRRAEAYWTLREWFEEGLIDLDPLDEDLAGQLVAIKYEFDSATRVKIESKKDMKKRGVASPDRADCVAMCLQRPSQVHLDETDEEDLHSHDHTEEQYGIAGDMLTRPL